MRWDTPIITVRGDVTLRSAAEFCRKLKDAADCREVEIRIDSDGGVIVGMTSMLDAMNRHQGKITTVCTGRAASAAAAVFLMGRERRMVPDSYVMIHRATRGGHEDDESRLASDLIADVMGLRLKIDREQIMAWMDETQYFDAGHCLRLGIAHHLAPMRLQTSRPNLAVCTHPHTASPIELDTNRLMRRGDAVLRTIKCLRRHSRTIPIPPISPRLRAAMQGPF